MTRYRTEELEHLMPTLIYKVSGQVTPSPHVKFHPLL